MPAPKAVKVPDAVRDKQLYIKARAYAIKAYPKHSPYRSAYWQKKYAELYHKKYGVGTQPFINSKRKGRLAKFFRENFDVKKINAYNKKVKKKTKA